MVKEYSRFNEKNIIKATLPRFDLLQDQKHDKRKIFFFFTWRLSFSAVPYQKSLYYKSINSFFNNEKLKKLLTQHNIELNTYLHHALLERNENFSLGNNIKIYNSTDISTLIKNSDLLITDYSSIWSDFFFMNKPVIFYRPDRHDKILIDQDRLNIDFSEQSNDLLFNITDDENTVIDWIEKYIKTDFELENDYKQRQNKLFYTKNNIREKILEQVGIL